MSKSDELMNSGNVDPLVRSLRGLQPSGTVSRDEVMFRAGQASLTMKLRWLWASNALFAVAVLGLVGWLGFQPAKTKVVERTVIVEAPASAPTPKPAPPPAPSPSPDPYPTRDSHIITYDSPKADWLRLREQMLRWGAEVLPRRFTPAGSVPREDIKRWRDVPDRSSLFLSPGFGGSVE